MFVFIIFAPKFPMHCVPFTIPDKNETWTHLNGICRSKFQKMRRGWNRNMKLHGTNTIVPNKSKQCNLSSTTNGCMCGCDQAHDTKNSQWYLIWFRLNSDKCFTFRMSHPNYAQAQPIEFRCFESKILSHRRTSPTNKLFIIVRKITE